nr:hypothetical protein [uncultured Agathobacter sp.]
MKKYGNIPFNRRVVAFVCLLFLAVTVLIPRQVVSASGSSSSSSTFIFKHLYYATPDSEAKNIVSTGTLSYTGGLNVRSYIIEHAVDDKSYKLDFGFVSSTPLDSFSFSLNSTDCTSDIMKREYKGVYFYILGDFSYTKSADIFTGSSSDIFYLRATGKDCNDIDVLRGVVADYVKTGVKSDGMIIGGSGYMPNTQAYSEIGCLDNVQMETYVTNKKELIDADENADLSKINQDKVIVYSSSTTSGIDLSKGGYRVQLYGSYAWQDKSGNIKSEDKGHKTFIKDWDAQDNIKGLDRSKYKWIDWKSANDKVEADKTDKAHKPNAFEKMTTYANYQYEPIWYLRIVSQDNKYGAWVKLYNSTNKGKYRSESVDDDDNAVPDSGGGYNKPKDTSEITGTGDTPEDAKNNVPKAEEKQDNDDLNDSANGNNSTFDKLEQFTKGIGDVPKMIADIFSFLPTWCLEVVAIGFALLIVLIVVKFIRG